MDRSGEFSRRLTWHPSSAMVRGWSIAGQSVLYASTRESDPVAYNHLWTVPVRGGAPRQLSNQWEFDGSFSAAGDWIAMDKMPSRMHMLPAGTVTRNTSIF